MKDKLTVAKRMVVNLWKNIAHWNHKLNIWAGIEFQSELEDKLIIKDMRTIVSVDKTNSLYRVVFKDNKTRKEYNVHMTPERFEYEEFLERLVNVEFYKEELLEKLVDLKNEADASEDYDD